jgi:hypothetical protein
MTAVGIAVIVLSAGLCFRRKTSNQSAKSRVIARATFCICCFVGLSLVGYAWFGFGDLSTPGDQAPPRTANSEAETNDPVDVRDTSASRVHSNLPPIEDVVEDRREFLSRHLGDLPEAGQKSEHVPQCEVLQFRSARLDSHWVYMTVGLTNPDPSITLYPSTATGTSVRAKVRRAIMERKLREDPSLGVPGYGFELIIVTPGREKWPLRVLEQAMAPDDIIALSRIALRDNAWIAMRDKDATSDRQFLVRHARPPLPVSHVLPNGRMHMLVLVAIGKDNQKELGYDHQSFIDSLTHDN